LFLKLLPYFYEGTDTLLKVGPPKARFVKSLSTGSTFSI